jgi:hypothetical protein
MNLNTATNEQLDEYRLKTASILKIDPFMLDYIWMSDPETGLKNRVLYAKRGAAEVLRQNLSISVESLVPSVAQDGLLSFQVTGKDKTGRQEIAVGSAYLDGLKGDKKAHAVMTAQTRAVRRLTLQFVGGGILDETEVQSQSALQAAPAASEATLAGSPTVMPPPQTAPSEAPGKDITPVSPVCVDCKQPLSTHTLVNSALTCLTKTDIQSAKTSAIPDVLKQQGPLDQEFRPPQTPASQTDIKADISGAEEPRKKRQYRRKNQVDISSPGQQTEPVDAIAEHLKGSVTIAEIAKAVLPEAKTEYHVPLPLHVGNTVVVVPDSALQGVPIQVRVAEPMQANPAPSAISKEKQEEYRTRLSKYYNDILPRGGMQSSESIGGPTMKTRKFAAIHTGVADTKQMTEQHWEDLFEFLDSHASNPKFLVEYINKALGVA